MKNVYNIDDIEELPPLREVINSNDLQAKKSLGQNFLLDLNLTKKIARVVGDMSDTVIFEIGPGPGGLTRGILTESNCKKLISIERDHRCVKALQPLLQTCPDRFELIEEDALQFNMNALSNDKYAIIANLPYNIATPLLINWLKQIDNIKAMGLMFQKEVALRITAEPSTKEYGRLSVICQWLCHCDIAFDIPASAFTPPPKITSSVVKFKPIKRSDGVSFAKMERLTSLAFGQRRKMLKKNLKSLNLDLDSIFAELDIKTTARAEELSVEDFIALAKYIE